MSKRISGQPLRVNGNISSNKIFAYESLISGETSNLNLGAGSNSLTSGLVPANKIWVIQHVVFMYSGTVAGVSMLPGFVANGTIQYFQQLAPPVTGKYYGQAAYDVILRVNDYCLLSIWGATAGDDAYWKWSGYQMDIT